MWGERVLLRLNQQEVTSLSIKLLLNFETRILRFRNLERERERSSKENISMKSFVE
jgi:hypothetical protein